MSVAFFEFFVPAVQTELLRFVRGDDEPALAVVHTDVVCGAKFVAREVVHVLVAE